MLGDVEVFANKGLAPSDAQTLGVVVIGRNEGERLKRCLASILPMKISVVYVDSGSSDGSVEFATKAGVSVLSLDMSMPFSAARARNEGFHQLCELLPNVEYVQFVDGDCDLFDDWLATAMRFLRSNSRCAVVAGRLKERFSDHSIYNRLGDVEWNFSGDGEVESVGGIFLARRSAFESVGGFNATVNAGEEPEMCMRLRAAGWTVNRLPELMAWHDLAMSRFSQWWTRAIRSGYGCLDVGRRFRLPKFERANVRARMWTAIPLVACSAGVAVGFLYSLGAGLVVMSLLLLLLPLQMARIAIRIYRRGYSGDIALAYGFFTVLSFFPQMLGQLKYIVDRNRGDQPKLIEYKARSRNG